MFVFLRDYFKKQLSDEKTNKEQDIINNEVDDNNSDISNIQNEEDNSFNDDNSSIEDSSIEEDNLDKKEKKEKRHKQHVLREASKNRRKETRQLFRRKKHRGLSAYSICLLLLFIGFLISRINLVSSPNEYTLTGTLYYSALQKSYIISYDIEELWNDNFLAVGETVCSPSYFSKDSVATTEKKGTCLSGTITEAGYRVKIDYGLPKKVSYEELKLYISKENLSKNISTVSVKIKTWNGNFLIAEIIPIKNTP